MSTYKELVYLVLDELKGISDDFTYTEEHIAFLLDKYRAFLLKQRYMNDPRKDIPQSNYQNLRLSLTLVPAVPGYECEAGVYLKTTDKIPFLLKTSVVRVYPYDQFNNCNITFVSPDRFQYVGYNKWLKNFSYATIGPDRYLYIKFFNPQMQYLKQINISGIFENASDAAELDTANCVCAKGSSCDTLDREFPIEEALVSPVVEMVVKELSQVEYRPKDTDNDAKDNLAEVNMGKHE